MIVDALLFLLNALLLNGPPSIYSSTVPHAEEKPSLKDTPETPEKSQDAKPKQRRTYREKELGVWKIIYVTQSRFTGLNLSSYLTSFLAKICICRDQWPLVIRFMKETYDIAPRGVILYVTHNLWDSLQGSLSMYFSSRILDLVFLHLHSSCIT